MQQPPQQQWNEPPNQWGQPPQYAPQQPPNQWGQPQQPPQYAPQQSWSQPQQSPNQWGQPSQWDQQAPAGWQQPPPGQNKQKRASKHPAVFYGAIVLALLSFVIGIYYALPHVYHIFVSGTHPPLDPQPTHVVLFLGIAVVCIIAALVTRPTSSR
jgi:hypothetical protein